MAFRDEAAHRHRHPGSGAPPGGNGRQRRDLTPSGKLLHGEEEQVRGDSGYRGIGKRAEHAHREVSWQIALPPGQRRGQGGEGEGPGAGAGGASVPDRERVFGCDMVRYRGLEKNVQRLAPLPGFSNLMIAQPHLS